MHKLAYGYNPVAGSEFEAPLETRNRLMKLGSKLSQHGLTVHDIPISHPSRSQIERPLEMRQCIAAILSAVIHSAVFAKKLPER